MRTGDEAVVLPIVLSDKAAPIACSLSADALGDRLDEWRSVLAGVRHRSTINGGVRLEFVDGVDLAGLAGLVAAEQDCCRFFSFALTVDGRGTGLEVRAPAEALDMIHDLFGAP